jgi:hypothetical protein
VTQGLAPASRADAIATPNSMAATTRTGGKLKRMGDSGYEVCSVEQQVYLTTGAMAGHFSSGLAGDAFCGQFGAAKTATTRAPDWKTRRSRLSDREWPTSTRAATQSLWVGSPHAPNNGAVFGRTGVAPDRAGVACDRSVGFSKGTTRRSVGSGKVVDHAEQRSSTRHRDKLPLRELDHLLADHETAEAIVPLLSAIGESGWDVLVVALFTSSKSAASWPSAQTLPTFPS